MENIEKYPCSAVSGRTLAQKLEKSGSFHPRPARWGSLRLRWIAHAPFLFFVLTLGCAAWFYSSFRPSPRAAKVAENPIAIAAEEAGKPTPGIVTVEEGDTLYSIAQRAYGRSARFEFLYRMNRDTLKSPRSLASGQSIKVP